VERAFEIVLELVQEHLCIWGRDDRAFTRYVATEDSAARRCPLLGMEAAQELHLRLGAQEDTQRADLIQVDTRCWAFRPAGRMAAGAAAGKASYHQG
jgi:hypothetical protein